MTASRETTPGQCGGGVQHITNYRLNNLSADDGGTSLAEVNGFFACLEVQSPETVALHPPVVEKHQVRHL